MAQLTWRPVEAPQGSTRDIAIAGGVISNSFDRMAQMLRDREANLRRGATDEQAAQILLAQDEAGLDNASQAALNTGNRRVDARAIAELVNSQRDVMLQRTGARQANALQREDLLDREGANAIAPLDMQIRELVYQGKTDEADSMLQAIAQEDPVAARGIRQRTTDWWNARSDGTDDRRQQLSDDRTHQRGVESNRISASQVALQRDRMAREDAEKRQREADIAFGRRFAGEITERTDASLSTVDLARELVKTPAFKRMSTERQDQVLANLEHKTLGRDARLTPTEAQLDGISPYTNQIAAVTDGVQRVGQARLNRFDADNRPSAVIRRAAELGDVKPEQVYEVAGPRGISKEAIERTRAQNPGLEYSHILAALQTDGSITDSDFFSRKTWFKDGSEQFYGGERALADVAQKVDDLLLNQGDLARTTNDRAKIEAPAANLLREAQRLETQLKQVRANGGDTSVFAARIAELEKRAAVLQRSVTPARGASGSF